MPVTQKERARRKVPVSYRRINFEQEFEKGRKAYDKVVGDWWRGQSHNRAHALAYRTIAKFMGTLRLPSRPTILDFACGSGSMLIRLFRQFPKARLIGVDGSRVLMEQAQRRLRRLDRNALDRVEFIEKQLPDFTIRKGLADVVVFTFPQIVAHPDEQEHYDRHGYKHPADTVVGRALARMREPDPEDEPPGHQEPESIFDELMSNRVITRSQRRMVKDGGLCVRVEYSNSVREGLTQLVQDRTAFEDGSLERAYGGRKSEHFFKYLWSEYHRSRVIEDVYHQTRDKSDMEGGYMISVLKAI